MTVKAKHWRWYKKKYPQQRSYENDRRKDIDIMFYLYRLCENINSWRIRSRLRRVMRQQSSIPSSATVAVQRHQVKRLWSKPRLKLRPTPRLTRNNPSQTRYGRARQHCLHSMGHISNAKQSFQLETFLLYFLIPSSLENSYNRHFPRLLGESRCLSTHWFLRFW